MYYFLQHSQCTLTLKVVRSPALRKFLAKVSTGQTYLSTNIYYWWHTKPITALQRYWLEKFFIMNMVYFDLLRVDVQDLVVLGGSFYNNRHRSTPCSVTGISVILLSQGTSWAIFLDPHGYASVSRSSIYLVLHNHIEATVLKDSKIQTNKQT